MRQVSGGRLWVDMARHAIDNGLAIGLMVFDDGRHADEFALGTVIELRRNGIPYAGDHPSAMPPPAGVVAASLDITNLTPDEAAMRVLAVVELERA